jgi:hypothetical protein
MIVDSQIYGGGDCQRAANAAPPKVSGQEPAYLKMVSHSRANFWASAIWEELISVAN